jgi:GntR family transcriptional regulator of vanillate catabolism
MRVISSFCSAFMAATAQEVTDAIAVRGHLEGMAARLVAEHGVSRQLQGDLQACLDAGDEALLTNPLTYESYAAYAAMNDRFHALILDACGNRALQRAVALNDKLPFAPASAMLPMQGTVTLDRDWMLYAHRQHHMLVAALKAGEGARAQALATEHTEVAQMNLRMALERRAEIERVMPAIRLVVGDSGRRSYQGMDRSDPGRRAGHPPRHRTSRPCAPPIRSLKAGCGPW